MNTYRLYLSASVWRALRPLLLSSLSCMLLAGCYIPVEGIRDANPGPTATPPWPYEPGTLPPGRSTPPQYREQMPGTSSPIPGSHTMAYPSTDRGNAFPITPPPPSRATPPQYADWLIDGPEGRGFAVYLSEGYRRYAKHEDNAHDFEDAARFLFRAGAVDRGERVEPELLSMRTLPAYAVDDLLYARQRLMAVFNRGATVRLPKLSASAQVNFDCWMEQQEENLQPHDIAQCRRGFEADIVRLETALIERVPTPPPPCTIPTPPPVQPACDTTPLYVLFDLDKHDLTSTGKEVVQNAADRAKRFGNIPLVVSGHTDRAGSDAYNDALSKRRLDTVIAALEARGIAQGQLARANYFGETQPRTETPDGVPHQDNRRVEIRLACNLPVRGPHCPIQPPAATPCPHAPAVCAH